MPKGMPIPIDTCQEILLRFDVARREGKGIMEACQEVGAAVERDEGTVWKVVKRFRPTTDMAKMYLRAKAMKLVKRAVRDANVSEAIDMLSRPNVGVLQPINKSEGGGGGFFLSVSADSCGAVKVGAALIQGDTRSLPPVSEEGTFDAYAMSEEDMRDAAKLQAPHQHRREGGLRVESALERARAKLRAARDQGHEGVSLPDE